MSSSPTVYLQDSAALNAFHSRLKLCPCPHCRQTGFLIFNGSLLGYGTTGSERIKRGQRVYCSNRFRKDGCGRTFCLLFAQFIKGWMIQAALIAAFISSVLVGKSRQAAWQSLGHRFCLQSAYRVWNRWLASQSHLRAWLCRKIPAPSAASSCALQETWLHLLTAFPAATPLAAFQHEFQTSLFPN